MADVQIIFKAVNAASGVIKALGGDTKGLENSFTELRSKLGFVQEGFEVLQKAYSATVTETVAYAEEVRDLSRALGTNSEEASKLIQIADDLKIPMASLEFGFRNALQKGVNPSIQGLKDLAKEYQAIEDPVQRAQFAMEKFGSRAGLQMQKVLELSTDQIDEMAESAAKLGLVLDDKATKAARDYEIALDELSDAQQGFMIQTGTKVIPVITDLINAGLEHNRQLEEENKWYLRLPGVGTIYTAILARQAALERDVAGATDEHTEAIDANIAELDRHEARLKDVGRAALENRLEHERLAAAYNDLQIFIAGPLGNEFDNFQETQDETRARAAELRAEIRKLEGEPQTKEGQEHLEELRGELDETNKALEENATAHEEATKRILFDLISQRAAMDGLTDAELQALNDLALGWGLIDQDTHTAVESIDRALADLAANEDIDEFKKKIDELDSSLRGLPTKLDIFITTHFKTEGRPGVPGTGGGGRQHGGPVWPGAAFLVGERGPELFMPAMAGNIMPNNQIATMRGGGNIEWNGDLIVVAAPGQDEEMVAEMAVTKLMARLRSGVNSGLSYAGA